MSKRAEFLKACLDRCFSYETIMGYVNRLEAVPADRKEEQAEILTAEIERDYPLRVATQPDGVTTNE